MEGALKPPGQASGEVKGQQRIAKVIWVVEPVRDSPHCSGREPAWPALRDLVYRQGSCQSQSQCFTQRPKPASHPLFSCSLLQLLPGGPD